MPMQAVHNSKMLFLFIHLFMRWAREHLIAHQMQQQKTLPKKTIDFLFIKEAMEDKRLNGKNGSCCFLP